MSLLTDNPVMGAFGFVSPQDAEGSFRAGLQALNGRRERQGLALLERSRHIHPNDARLWQVSGLLHRQLEEMEPAIRELTRAAELAPSDAKIAHALARSHLEAGLPSSHLFRRARQLAPRDGNVVLGLGAALYAEGEGTAAMEELDRALIENPGWLPGHNALCKLRFELGDATGYAASFDRALATFPKDLPLWRGLFILLTQGDRYEEALEAIERARAAMGPNLLCDANEAVCRAELGQTESADRLFAALTGVTDPTIGVRQVRHLLRSGRYREAAALAERMVSGPAALMVWPYLSVAWRLIGDPRWEWLEGDARFIGVFDLSERLGPLEPLASLLRRLHMAKAQPIEQSVRGGTQTDGSIFPRLEPEIRALRAAIVEAVGRYVAQLPPPQPRHPLLISRRGPIRFSGAWSVRLAGQGHHSNHVHPEGWISSALYVSLPQDSMGGPGHAGWLAFGEVTELGLELPPIKMVEPKPGRLVLFPSTMWHGTRPFPEGERLTVAFDVARPA